MQDNFTNMGTKECYTDHSVIKKTPNHPLQGKKTVTIKSPDARLPADRYRVEQCKENPSKWAAKAKVYSHTEHGGPRSIAHEPGLESTGKIPKGVDRLDLKAAGGRELRHGGVEGAHVNTQTGARAAETKDFRFPQDTSIRAPKAWDKPKPVRPGAKVCFEQTGAPGTCWDIPSNRPSDVYI